MGRAAGRRQARARARATCRMPGRATRRVLGRARGRAWGRRQRVQHPEAGGRALAPDQALSRRNAVNVSFIRLAVERVGDHAASRQHAAVVRAVTPALGQLVAVVTAVNVGAHGCKPRAQHRVHPVGARCKDLGRGWRQGGEGDEAGQDHTDGAGDWACHCRPARLSSTRQ